MADAARAAGSYFSVLDDKRALAAWLDRPAGPAAPAGSSASLAPAHRDIVLSRCL